MKQEITKLSSKGQIVIPKDIRDALSLKEGDSLLLTATDKAIMIRSINPPSKEEFEEVFKKTHEFAKKHKLTEKDMWDAIKKVRK